MDIYQAFATFMNNSTQINLFGRVYPVQAPQDISNDYAVWAMKENEPLYTHNSNLTDGTAIFQIDKIAPRISTVDNFITTMRDNMQGGGYELAADSEHSISVVFCTTSNEFDAFDDKRQLYIRSLDLTIKYIKKEV